MEEKGNVEKSQREGGVSIGEDSVRVEHNSKKLPGRRIYRGLKPFDKKKAYVDLKGINSRVIDDEKLVHLRSPEPYTPKQVVRKDIFVNPDGTKLVQFDNFLSGAETCHYRGEVELAGFDSLAKEYPPEYRSGKRVLMDAKKVADQFYQRLLQHLKKEDVVNMRPYGFDSEGAWVPVGMNPCIRCICYDRGEQFSPHRDGVFNESTHRRSVYTFLIYLSTNWDGATSFFPGNPEQEKEAVRLKDMSAVTLINEYTANFDLVGEEKLVWDQVVETAFKSTGYSAAPIRGTSAFSWLRKFVLPKFSYCNLKERIPRVYAAMKAHYEMFMSIYPQRGRALLFNHEVLHMGCSSSSIKYILKTEVIFERLQQSIPPPHLEPKFHHLHSQMKEYYAKSDYLEKSGNLSESLDFYLKEIAEVLRSLPRLQ